MWPAASPAEGTTSRVTARVASVGDVLVRPARPADVAAVAEVQLTVWRECYGRLLPSAVLEALTTAEAEARWREAVEAPPSPRHRLLVAVDDGVLVGLAALGPADDPGLDPPTAGELYALLVHPGAHRRGHGSRLLNAAVEAMRADGVRTAVTWAFDADAALVAFLESSGWAPDGAARSLDLGEPVHQLRLHTDVG